MCWSKLSYLHWGTAVQGKIFQPDLTPANWLFCMAATPHSTHPTKKGARRSCGSNILYSLMLWECKRGEKPRDVEENTLKVLIIAHPKCEPQHSALHPLRLGELKGQIQQSQLEDPVCSSLQGCLWKKSEHVHFFKLFSPFKPFPLFRSVTLECHAMTWQQAASKCAVLLLKDPFFLLSCVHELFTFDPKEADNGSIQTKDKLIAIDLSVPRRVFFVFKSKSSGSDPASCLIFWMWLLSKV